MSTSLAQIRVEEIKNEEGVIKFLDTYYFKGNRKDTVISFERKQINGSLPIDTAVHKFIKALKYPKWAKADFNRDRKLDFVFAGFFENENTGSISKVIAFISNGHNYAAQEISLYGNQSSIYFINSFSAHPYLIVGAADDYSSNVDYESYPFKERLRFDTLKFYNKEFVEFRLRNNSHKVDTIKIKFLNFRRPVFDTLIISSDGTAILSKYERFNDTSDFLEKRRFIKHVLASDTKRIFSLANSLPIDFYNERYSPIDVVLDGFEWNTEFTYEGKRKKISDRLATGPAGLRKLYEELWFLMNTNNWQRLK
jgi:hypothetical protein